MSNIKGDMGERGTYGPMVISKKLINQTALIIKFISRVTKVWTEIKE